jgi:hypothetical protein
MGLSHRYAAPHHRLDQISTDPKRHPQDLFLSMAFPYDLSKVYLHDRYVYDKLAGPSARLLLQASCNGTRRVQVYPESGQVVQVSQKSQTRAESSGIDTV